MPRFAILTSHLTTGSAVSSDALGMYKVLGPTNDVRVYAGSWDLQEPQIRSLDELPEFLLDPNDVLIYHHSIGWDAGFQLLQTLKCRKVIKYHNVTPAEFFSQTSKWHEDKCHEGRQQLLAIARAGFELYLSDSDYNRGELLSAGASTSRNFVVPPFHYVDRLQLTPADMTTLETYRDGKAVLLSVSRVAPHKGCLELLETFAIYHYDHNLNSRLLIVGREEEAFAAYSDRLRKVMKFLLLDEAVIFTGEVSDEVLKAYYLLSSVFLSTSRHEGFSVPLVEAMALKVPIVSFASTGIPETVGEAGIVVDDSDPKLLAEAANLVVEDEITNVALGMAGWQRYQQKFTNERITNAFLQALNRLN